MLNNLTNSWNDDESEQGCDLWIHRSHMLRAFFVVPVFEKPLSKHEVDLPRGSKLELYWHRCRLHWSFIRCSHWLVIERRDNRKYTGSHVEYMSQFGTRVVAEICHAKQNIPFSSQSPHHDNDAVVMFPVTCLLFGAHQRKATYPGYFLCHSYAFWGCNHDWQQTGKPQAEEVRMYWWSNPSHFTTVKQGYCPSVFHKLSSCLEEIDCSMTDAVKLATWWVFQGESSILSCLAYCTLSTVTQTTTGTSRVDLFQGFSTEDSKITSVLKNQCSLPEHRNRFDNWRWSIVKFVQNLMFMYGS